MTKISQSVVRQLILGIFFALFALILWPFLPSIIFAIFFTVIFYPVYTFMQQKLRLGKNGAALFVVLATMVFILSPLVTLITLVTKEALTFATVLDQNSIMEFFDTYRQVHILGYEIELQELQERLVNLLQNTAANIYEIAKNIGSAATNFTFLFFVFLFLYFYFLRDGKSFVLHIEKLLPFDKKQIKILSQKFRAVAKTVFFGNLCAALISGIIAFIGFSAFQLQGALIWALLATILALIPTMGTFFVYLIGSTILAYTANWFFVAGFAAYYIFLEILLVQNFLKPRMVDDKIPVHPILVFFSLVGGVIAFDSAGILFGPLIVVFFLTLLDFFVKKS